MFEGTVHMEIVRFAPAHAEEAAELALEAYVAERRAVAALPGPDAAIGLKRAAAAMAGGAGVEGFAAVKGGRLMGFLSGYPAEHFFGSHQGVYVPPHGHGARQGADRRFVYQRLYEAASGAWVKSGRLTHAVSMYAHDAEAIDAWYWLGFGLRCVDAVRPLSDVNTSAAASLSVRKASPEDAEALFSLHAEHCGYYRRPPLFMPTVELESGLGEFRQWLAGEGNHLWAAYSGDEPISYIRIRRGWGNIPLDDAGTYHICGAFTSEDARRAGAGALLLSEIVTWLREQGCARLGVDYESFNIYGSRFWGKHFVPFLFSAVRCIDDRIVEVSRDA